MTGTYENHTLSIRSASLCFATQVQYLRLACSNCRSLQAGQAEYHQSIAAIAGWSLAYVSLTIPLSNHIKV